MQTERSVLWQPTEVASHHLDKPVPVIAARGIEYVPNANRLQNFNIYLPRTTDHEDLIGTKVADLPDIKAAGDLPHWLVHVHGGAWRDPVLSASTVEAGVAHAFCGVGSSDSRYSGSIDGVASINYTLSPFPTHPTLPYDPVKDQHSDPAREAVHPAHIRDVLAAFSLLRSLGLKDRSYILTGHSCGACLAFQSVLQSPQHWGSGFERMPDPPQPAALLGFNGLYDLPTLVEGLGDTHAQLSEVYQNLQSIAFGADSSSWPAASPARVDSEQLAKRLEEGKAPSLVIVDQSREDQLVPMNQMQMMKSKLESVSGVKVVQGNRAVGEHAAPWKEGTIIWDSVQDALKILSSAA